MPRSFTPGACVPAYLPPWGLRSGLVQTLYVATRLGQHWTDLTDLPHPPYREQIFVAAGGVPLYGWIAIPPNPRGTIVGTYGITGSLDNQWYLQLLGRKAYAQGFAVVLFDWRAHGKSAALSPTLTSDGLQEGPDFVYIAAQSKTLGCPAPFWFTGYSLGGQLALWAIAATEKLLSDTACRELRLDWSEVAGAAVICPNLDSNRSLKHLMQSRLGRYIDHRISQELKKLAWHLHASHPGMLSAGAIEQANTIEGFDRQLVISRLGYTTVADYYRASSPLPLLPSLGKPTLILYAADDPLFAPSLIPELQQHSQTNPNLDLRLTRHGGHVGYFSSRQGQKHSGDPDRWWAWNRVLDWCTDQLQFSDRPVIHSVPNRG